MAAEFSNLLPGTGNRAFSAVYGSSSATTPHMFSTSLLRIEPTGEIGAGSRLRPVLGARYPRGRSHRYRRADLRGEVAEVAVAGKLPETTCNEVAGGVGVAPSVCDPCADEGLLRSAQGGVGGDAVEEAALGVRQVFQEEAMPFGQRAGSLLIGIARSTR